MTPQALASAHARAFSATRAWSADEFETLLGQKGVRLLGDAAAFALIRTIVDETEILTLATDPAKRRCGRARAVLQLAEAQAIEGGATRMFLEVAEDNSAAKALYATAGFTQIGRRPGYYLPKNAAPVAALVLCKELGGR